MPVENQEDKTIEVLGAPHSIDEELLSLYFENKRRSGGGPLVSVEKRHDRVLVVFEEAEVAARVLSRGSHVFHNAELTVRKPASKDPQRLLLRGFSSGTGTELIELYVENVMGMEENDYTLYPSPGRDLVLIHLHQPLSKDFQKLQARISKKPLIGSKITLERVEQTDSILVEKLHPGINTDKLTLYFESSGGGNQDVKEVTMMSETTARVSFADFNAVNHVMTLSHKLENVELAVSPYFAFLQPAESIASASLGANMSSQHTASEAVAAPAAVEHVAEVVMEDLTVHKEPCTSHIAIPDPANLASEAVAAPAAVEHVAEVVMEDFTVHKEPCTSHIAIADPAKLALLGASAEDIKRTHPDVHIQIEDDGVHLAGPDEPAIQQLKNTVWEFLGNIAQAHLTFDQEKAQFLANGEVKERLLRTMSEQGVPAVYTVSDSVVVVTSLSLDSVSQACVSLKSQMCDFSIPVEKQYESELYSAEWSAFLQTLGLCSARVADGGGNVEVLTLKGMENEMGAKILKFLTTPVDRETVISMVPEMLRFIQIHCHQLLAEMDQVSIVPLEEGDVRGLRIRGRAGACQMAAELLQDVVGSICTRTITVNRPGVARFLLEEEGEGTSILAEMQTKFTVYIGLEKVLWEPFQNEDVFEAAWKMMSQQNFQRVLLDGSTQDLTAVSPQTDQNLNPTNSSDRDFAGQIPVITGQRKPWLDQAMDTEEDLYTTAEDLYTAGEAVPSSQSEQETHMVLEDAPHALVDRGVAGGPLLASDGARGPDPSNLEEDAQLSLAIQYSMDSTKRSLVDEEDELQRALELSMVWYGEPSVPTKKDKAVHMSLQDAVKAANTAEIFVCATYDCDLIRVDIALKKKVTQRQVEEKMDHKSLKNLSTFQQRCLEVIKRKHAVEIQIQGTRATISGFKAFVDGALPDLMLLLKKTPIDAEILGSVQWVRHEPGSSEMTPYAPQATVLMETARRMKRKKIDILLNNLPHSIDFEKMQEFNVTSGKSVNISRKLLSSLDLSTDNDFSLLSGLTESSIVDERSDEFRDVVRGFYENIEEYHSKIRIIKVEKLTNSLLYNQYKLKKVSITQSATEKEIEQTLYHGTSEASVKEICIHGFNRSFCGKNATVYGQGVYFAVKSAVCVHDTYSPPNAYGHKFVFVTKVLTGDYAKGLPSMKTAPLKECYDIPLRYDSVTDNISNPSLFVIFNDTQAYAEYLITCQRVNQTRNPI